ncbi:hypothetical protein niasHS_002173 [Heterodera schachtii]|uniref:Secreted protein n=1 Tax=Heterodera schachtii TaxID=97005 RepID=A0ABD2KMH7_HETSC
MNAGSNSSCLALSVSLPILPFLFCYHTWHWGCASRNTPRPPGDTPPRNGNSDGRTKDDTHKCHGMEPNRTEQSDAVIGVITYHSMLSVSK